MLRLGSLKATRKPWSTSMPWIARRLASTTTANTTAASKPYYVTTPIFYVNAAPHIGHLHSMVLADILKRWHAWRHQEPTFFMTGTDEHGMKVQRAAEAAGVPTHEFVDSLAVKFQALARASHISHDRFIRTTDADHKLASQEFWRRLEAAGFIYKGSHSGWYCVSDETFYPETQVEKKDGIMVSVETGKAVEWTSEENYFFALSKIQPLLLQHLKDHNEFVVPESRYKQILKEVEAGLDDLSVSRPTARCAWGIPVPGDDSQVMYVWLDALVNYLTSAGFPGPHPAWPADVHVVGKDIIRFHSIYWPAFLLAANMTPPKQVVVHSHWTMQGSKMSKSLGNVVDPIETMQLFGVDSVKFFLANDSYLAKDSDYSNDRILARHNTELVNKYSNLVVRICGKAFDIPRALTQLGPPETPLAGQTDALLDKVTTHMGNFATAPALAEIRSLISTANTYVQETEPWTLKKDVQKQDAIIADATEAARIASILLLPFIPQIAASMLDRLAVLPDKRTVEFARYGADKSYGVGANRKGDYPIKAIELEL